MRSSDDCRIAVFLDHCEGVVSHLLDGEMMQYISGLPQVVSCDQDENLSSPERLEMLTGKLKEGQADRGVIVGGSPKAYEESFRRLSVVTGLNPYMFLVANVREQVAWVIHDREKAREKARAIIATKIKEASLLNPIGREKIEIPKKAIVIGGGIVGVKAALALADANIGVTLLSRAKDIGGKAIQLAHFYDRPDDASSWFGKQVERVKEHPRIDVRTSVELRGLEGFLGDYRITIRGPLGKREVVGGSAVLLAWGYDIVPNTEGIFGHRCFISPPGMEAMLRDGERSLVNEKGEPIKTVTFILDLVNETIKIDSANAIKNGLLLKSHHDCTVYVVCRDIKVSLDGMERQYRKAREMGVMFIKYDDPPRFSLVNGQINVEVKEVSTRVMGEEYTVSIPSDLVVLSEKFVPSKDNEMLAAMLDIPLLQGGHLMDDNPQFTQVRANRRGVFLAGGCRFPQTLDEALVEAEAAASGVTQLLSQGVYEYDLAVAEIDPAKCACCLTCPRVCPHSAIVVEQYAPKNIYVTAGYDGDFTWRAARVLATQCYGCGICVSSCPTKAISLKHLTDAEILLQMEA
jgi:heterodisulfide reductase subunit A-like polyferredoxin